METDTNRASDELDIGELMATLWNSRLLIGGITAAFLAAGIAAYFLVAPKYRSDVTAEPIRQTQFAPYLELAQEGAVPKEGENSPKDGAFPYTPATLFTEFSSYVTDPVRISEIARTTGIVEQGEQGDSDEAYARRVSQFVSGVRFTVPKPQEVQAGVQFLKIVVEAGDQQKLTTFMRKLLTDASADMAADLAAEVKLRADAIRDELQSQIAGRQVEIDSRRQAIENIGADDIVRLTEQSRIAHTLGIEKPLSLSAIEAAEAGKSGGAQFNSSEEQPDYFQGYIALDEQIAALQNRKNADAFIPDLRKLEQEMYVLKNDPRPARINALLERSPLHDPASAVLARYSVAAASARKVFPSAIIFGAGSILAGLLVGSLAALVRHRVDRARTA